MKRSQIGQLSFKEKRELLRELLRRKAQAQGAASSSYPLSFGQRALWFIDQLDRDSGAYNVAAAARVRSGLDVEAFHRALEFLVARHEVLRCVFTSGPDGPVQTVRRDLPVAFTSVDATGWDDTRLMDQLTSNVRTPFHLERETPLRGTVYSRPGGTHVVLLVIHHIAFDGLSGGLFMNELVELYDTAIRGEAPELEPGAKSYWDYLTWHAHMLAGPEGEALRAYWMQRLSGELPELDLPTDFPRPPVMRYHGATEQIALPDALSARLRDLAKREQCTLFSVFMAALVVMLHRYSGQDEMLIGTPASGRTEEDFLGVIGYFVNPLVLRLAVAKEDSVRTLIERVQRESMEALAHQDYPFSLLVEELHPARDPSRTPIFQVMLEWQRSDRFAEGTVGREDAALQLEMMSVPQQEGQFDLQLSVKEGPAAIAGQLRYSTELFRPDTGRRMVTHLAVVLEAMVEDVHRPVSALPLMTASEHRQILVEWNATERDHGSVACLHHLFEATVKRDPERVAAVCGDESITYGELNRRSNQLAHALIDAGAEPEGLVGICLDRSVDMLVALLGVLKSGAAYVPLDPTFPASRLAYIIGDADLSALVTETKQQALVSSEGIPRILLDQDAGALDARPDTLPDVAVDAANLAYVIYTSGSTGQPKGVEIEHGGAVNLIASMAEQPGLAPDDVLYAVTTLSFDISVLELFLPLAVGASVVIAARNEAFDGRRILRSLKRHNVSVMQATPATWQLLMQSGWRDRMPIRAWCGGEPLTKELAIKIVERADELWNLYGPTEATVWATVEKITKPEDGITIGRPLPNYTAYILDRERRPVPIGVQGELFLGGAGLARGYRCRPALTAEKFVSPPRSHRTGERLYATGDLARFLPDGRIDIAGRIDYQVKIRGFRVELGEIESELMKNRHVNRAVVHVREDRPGDRRLVAYLIGEGDEVPDEATLRAALRAALPDYMVPSAYVWMDAYPLTPNKKVDRRALPAPERGVVAERSQREPPQTPSEKVLAKIFSDVLGIDEVGRFDNFFELGGHSLLGMQVVERFEQATGFRMQPAEMFAQSVAQIAAYHERSADPASRPA